MKLSFLGMLTLAACGSTQPAADHPNPAAAECVAHRTAAQLACSDPAISKTEAEADACRAKVKAEVDCTKDGGTDAAHD
jgi:hypothetical protein